MAKTKRNTKNILKKVQFQVQYTGLLLLQWYLFSMIFLICPPPFIRLSYTILSLSVSLTVNLSIVHKYIVPKPGYAVPGQRLQGCPH